MDGSEEYDEPMPGNLATICFLWAGVPLPLPTWAFVLWGLVACVLVVGWVKGRGR